MSILLRSLRCLRIGYLRFGYLGSGYLRKQSTNWAFLLSVLLGIDSAGANGVFSQGNFTVEFLDLLALGDSI